MNDLHTRIENLSASKRLLLELMARQRGRTKVYPLSYGQQRLWFLDQLEPGSTAYNVPLAVRLRGELKAAAVRKSLEKIVQRHEVLRTRFETHQGQPVQVIEEPGPLAMPVWDISQEPEEEREAKARELAAEEAVRPFDLERGPLVRMGLIRVGERDHVLLLTMHHIVSDGWSLGILVREFVACYEAYIEDEDKEPELAELAIQYADFAVWQRGWLQGEVLEAEMKYWRRQLADVEPLELPTDHPRPAVASHRGEVVPVYFREELIEKLKELSQSEGVTLFMMLLAAWQMVLGRYAAKTDAVAASENANRNPMQTEGLIGFFVNQLVLRGDLRGNPSFREYLGRVRRTVLEGYEHQDVPFEKLVEELDPERDLKQTPLFQSMLVLQNAAENRMALPGLEVKLVGSEFRVAKFDLS